VFPHDLADMVSLPGIGRSTAGAIASFCFRMPTPVLDANVKRVLRRWHGLPNPSDKELWIHAQQAIDRTREPDLWNQSMMELGATQCVARKPRCETCPVKNVCVSAKDTAFFASESRQSNQKQTSVLHVHWQIHIHRCASRGIWMEQRPEKGIWGGLWTPPIIELACSPDAVPDYVHHLSHRRLHLYARKQSDQPCGSGKWVNDIHSLALPVGIYRLLKKSVC